MNRLVEKEGRPLIMPMYYAYPNRDEAYSVGNQYFFGTQLIAAPITHKVNKETHMADVEIWLPDGRYTDIFTGEVYRGGKTVVQRDITETGSGRRPVRERRAGGQGGGAQYPLAGAAHIV